MKQEKNKIKWTKKGLIRGTWQMVRFALQIGFFTFSKLLCVCLQNENSLLNIRQ